ncbi:MAG: LysR family transcriptional regulator [Clostridia bacterium]|nr:LysR family transcriptional regulator [Clostridia bacterium]
MTLRHIRIFEAVCQADCNLTKAAGQLHMTQPAVSLAIGELENYYGVKLFERISRRLYLSEAGKQFRVYAQGILMTFDDMEKSIRNWDALGRIRVGASVSIGSALMPEFAGIFAAEHPETDLQVRIDRSDRLQEALLTGELDMALIEGIVHDESLRAEDFMEDSLAVIASPALGLPEGILPVETFLRQRFLLREMGSGTREIFAGVLTSAGYPVPSPAWESLSTAALIHAAEAGLGIAVVPRRMVSENTGLRFLTVEGLTFRRKYQIVYHKNKFLTAAARHFLEICRRDPDAAGH